MSCMRQAAGIHEEISDVQNLLSEACQRRSYSWYNKIKLVGRKV
jgi:hypothetical protein